LERLNEFRAQEAEVVRVSIPMRNLSEQELLALQKLELPQS
jgi:hypothetical protein